MVIDFHTHIFPDRIAPKALSSLASIIQLQPSMNGTREGLLSSMAESGIDLSVVLPVITDPHQFDSILRFAAETNELYENSPGRRLCSFAGMHPEIPDYKEKLRLRSYGLVSPEQPVFLELKKKYDKVLQTRN